jgi:hypothetical protein
MIEAKVSSLGPAPTNVSAIFNVASIAELKTIKTPFLQTGTMAKLDGYFVALDGGGGEFYFNAQSEAVENGGTVIAPNAGGGRWLRKYAGRLNVKWFGAKGDGVSNDTAALQAALDTGLDLFFPRGSYACVGLTLANQQQAIFSEEGYQSALVRNANGVILTVSGYAAKIHGLAFRGEGAVPVFTGDNLVITSDDVDVHNVHSYRTLGRALKSTGNHTFVLGGLFQTSDATGAGFDIELGVAGTATLYQKVQNIRTSQATGGIKLTDTGSTVVMGSQFGKLSILSGTGPAGSNGGLYLGNRILGAITVAMPSAVFAGNQIGAVAVTFTVGTSGCRLDTSNVFATGSTVINNGNTNNLIMREVSTGSGSKIQIGDDNTYTVLSMVGGVAGAGAILAVPGVKLDNNVNTVWKAADGSDGLKASMTNGNNFSVLNACANAAFQFVTTGVNSLYQIFIDGTEKIRVSAAGVFLGGNTAFDTQGAGSPEGVVTAPIGSTYRRTNGGAGTSFYVKESGVGNTGWVGK